MDPITRPQILDAIRALRGSSSAFLCRRGRAPAPADARDPDAVAARWSRHAHRLDRAILDHILDPRERTTTWRALVGAVDVLAIPDQLPRQPAGLLPVRRIGGSWPANKKSPTLALHVPYDDQSGRRRRHPHVSVPLELVESSDAGYWDVARLPWDPDGGPHPVYVFLRQRRGGGGGLRQVARRPERLPTPTVPLPLPGPTDAETIQRFSCLDDDAFRDGHTMESNFMPSQYMDAWYVDLYNTSIVRYWARSHPDANRIVIGYSNWYQFPSSDQDQLGAAVRSARLVLIPQFVHASHYRLMVIAPAHFDSERHREVCAVWVADSLRPAEFTGDPHELVGRAFREALRKVVPETTEILWPRGFLRCPHQGDTNACGVYCMMFVEMLACGAPLADPDVAHGHRPPDFVHLADQLDVCTDKDTVNNKHRTAVYNLFLESRRAAVEKQSIKALHAVWDDNRRLLSSSSHSEKKKPPPSASR